MAQQPVAKEIAHRFAELVGSDLTQHEAARAVEIGTRTGERLMTKPEIRETVERARAARSRRVGELDEAISTLLKRPTPMDDRTGSGARRGWSWL